MTEQKVRTPVSALEKKALSLLQGCTFTPGSAVKRFVMRSSLDQGMTEKQRAWFWKVVHMYRRQHKCQALVDYAAEQIEKNPPPPPRRTRNKEETK
jgi:hypothetical protein